MLAAVLAAMLTPLRVVSLPVPFRQSSVCMGCRHSKCLQMPPNPSRLMQNRPVSEHLRYLRLAARPVLHPILCTEGMAEPACRGFCSREKWDLQGSNWKRRL